MSKRKSCLRGFLKHAQVDERVLVAGEADEAHLAGLLRVAQRLHGAALGEDAVGIVETDDLVKLHQVDVVGLRRRRHSSIWRAASPWCGRRILVIRKTLPR